MSVSLEPATPASLGLDEAALDRLCHFIDSQIAENRYPGAQIAVARDGKLALTRTFGKARLDPATPARDDNLWLLYSNTKVIVAAALWCLVEEGALTFQDRVADHLQGFGEHGKGDITIVQLLTHQGGFPNAKVPADLWHDHTAVREAVCDFRLEWAPGSRVDYHTLAAHWVAAMLIEALARVDYRDFIRTRLIEPLGLGRSLFVGLPEAGGRRAVDMHQPTADGAGQERREEENTSYFRAAGVPGGGGYATAVAMATFYQMLVNGGRLGSTRLFSPRLIQYVTRNFTDDRTDHYMGMPMHRGLGPHVRGYTDTIRGLGSLGSPATFGHGGVGSSYCWADPETGVSFAYLTNSRIPDPWHSRRLDIISNFVHTAIEDATCR
jgi:CubicO group peptidase (beta-lactamase class C family)